MAVAACSSSGSLSGQPNASPSPVPTATPSVATPAADEPAPDDSAVGVRFAPVLGDAAAGGAVETCPNESFDSVECLILGDTPTVEPAGVALAEPRETPAGASGVWMINLTLTPDGIDRFNLLATECFNRTSLCPTGRAAILLLPDMVVLSAPNVNAQRFEADQISISGNFDQETAERIAGLIRQGAAG